MSLWPIRLFQPELAYESSPLLQSNSNYTPHTQQMVKTIEKRYRGMKERQMKGNICRNETKKYDMIGRYQEGIIRRVFDIFYRQIIMELNKEQVKQLYPGIKIRKRFTIIDQQETYLFFLDVQDLKIIDFQCDFTGSSNITIKNRSNYEKIISKTVQPRQATLVAQVELHLGWKLQTTFRFRRRPIPKEKQLQYIHPEISAIQSQKTLVETVLKKVDISLTPIEDISKILQKSKIKYIDSQFPPDEFSIVGSSDKNLIDDTVNHWRRPSDIYENYSIIDRMSNSHLIKGKLSDNSFFSVVACLTVMNPSLIERLFFNQNQVNPNGIYRLRLCKNGQWQTVTIDDLIPCQPLAKPKFASSSANQIWINLLQKAYAKMHKRYLNLYDLQVSNVFNDLTGCPTYIQEVANPETKEKIIENLKNKHIVVFYGIEQKQFDEDEFIPLKNYAYPIVSHFTDDQKLVYKILSHNQEKIEINEEDVLKKFKYACICYAKNWEEVRIKGKFITAEAGQQNNQYPISMSRWYYSMDLPQASEIHICLHQEDILIGNNQNFKPYAYCSLLLLQKSQKSILKPVLCKNFSHNRQIQIRKHLQPGNYLIIPFINSESAIKKPQNEQDQIIDIFKKLDLLMRRQLKYSELMPFFKVCNQIFDEQIFNDLLKNYSRGKKGIGLQAFRQMWAKNRIYWKDSLQYYEKERLFTLSVHSNIEINILIKNNIGTQYNNRAHCELVNKLGQDLQLANRNQYQKYAKIKIFKSKCHIIEYMVENKHERKIQIEFDCTQSAGYYFVPKKGKTKIVLDSGQKQFIMKLIPFEKSEIKDLIKHEKIKVKAFD